MVSAEIVALFKDTLGLDTATIGSFAIERALRERLAASTLEDAHDYCERVRTSDAEKQELIEAVVVPETWFFRDREAFVEVARLAAALCRARPERMLRLLSLPCSSGEEPYSISMALIDAGIDASRFQIDAIDISGRALDHARRALYGKNSFRGTDLQFRDRFFEATPAGYRLSEPVRRAVNFVRANLLAADFAPPAREYDAIFCRNLLIYFDRATQERAIAIVQRSLKPGGVVFFGPAEAGLLFAHDLVWSKVPLAFAFENTPALPRVRAAAPPAPVRRAPRSSPVEAAIVPRARPVARVPLAVVAELVGIEEAGRLADLGRFTEAAITCEAHIRARGPSPQALHLMGLICSADGSFSRADNYFRQALYLDPNYGESAIHLALLLEKRGDAAGAQLLRDRARRVKAARAN